MMQLHLCRVGGLSTVHIRWHASALLLLGDGVHL